MHHLSVGIEYLYIGIGLEFYAQLSLRWIGVNHQFLTIEGRSAHIGNRVIKVKLFGIQFQRLGCGIPGIVYVEGRIAGCVVKKF